MRSEVNPGYKGYAREDDFPVDAGPVIRCPECKRIIMEARLDVVKIRCKCGKWVYLKREEEG